MGEWVNFKHLAPCRKGIEGEGKQHKITFQMVSELLLGGGALVFKGYAIYRSSPI